MYIHLPVQFICLFRSSACLVLCSSHLWLSFHLPIHSFPCPLLCLSFHLPAHSYACVFTFVLFIYTCPFICTAHTCHLTLNLPHAATRETKLTPPLTAKLGRNSYMYYSPFPLWLPEVGKLFFCQSANRKSANMINSHTAQLCLKTVLKSKRFVYSLYF
jgi:hypothetical protein